MATPRVAGIAALWSQQTGERGSALWRRLILTARKIGQPVAHVGAGLVPAPSKSKGDGLRWLRIAS
jgi:hypothetical protein